MKLLNLPRLDDFFPLPLLLRSGGLNLDVIHEILDELSLVFLIDIVLSQGENGLSVFL